MQQRLRQVLNGLASPEQIQLLCEACEVLEGINYRDHELSIEQIIAKPDMVPSDLVFHLIEDVFKPTFAEYLTAMGVRLTEEAGLREYKSVLFWLSRVDNYEDFDAINGIASSDESSEDNLAEILSVVSSEPADNFILILDSVADALLSRIAELTEGHEQVLLPSAEEFSRAKARTSAYIDWLVEKVPDFVTEHVKLDDLRLGYPAEVILERNRGYLEIQTDPVCARLLVLNLFSSDLPDAAIVPTMSNEVEILFTDVLRALSVSKHCQDILRQLNHA